MLTLAFRLGLAEGPPDGSSFGTHRGRLIAPLLYDALERTKPLAAAAAADKDAGGREREHQSGGAIRPALFQPGEKTGGLVVRITPVPNSSVWINSSACVAYAESAKRVPSMAFSASLSRSRGARARLTGRRPTSRSARSACASANQPEPKKVRDHMPALAHRLERTVVINAPREAVFRYFTGSSPWANWFGADSTIDSRPGGKIYIRYPEGTEVAGEVIEVHPPERIVFTYGYVNGKPIPAGSSRVTIRLEIVHGATRLTLAHELADAAVRDQHVQGWRYQLSLFSNLVADEINSGAAGAIDAWFESWAEPDAAVRERTLGKIAAPDIRFHDRYSNIAGLVELFPHIAAAQHFMPGMRMRRAGDVRHCQGAVLADFAVVGPDGNERARGTNLFAFGPTGQIESATGFMNSSTSA